MQNVSGEIIYQRTKETTQSTTGMFFITGTDIKGYMIEPAGPSTSIAHLDRRIPAGTYKLIKNTGAKKGLRLFNDSVPPSRAILIHVGNYPKDTLGCLLPGTTIGQNFVGGSAVKLNEILSFFESTGFSGATIKIQDIMIA